MPAWRVGGNRVARRMRFIENERRGRRIWYVAHEDLLAIRKLMTIGYEGASVVDFLDALSRAGVTTILDVREIAASRRRGFAKTALRKHLEAANILYRHEPLLGSPREIRHRLRATHDYARFFREFARHLKKHQDVIAMLAAELTGNVALLCYERDYHQCHRKSVAAAFAAVTALGPLHLCVDAR
jgi:uncharacterized protein (DUF488 family)